MKRRFSISKFNLLLVLILSLEIASSHGQTSSPFSLNESPLPAPTSPVMDYAGVLDATTKQQLENRVIAFRDKTNPKVELAVAIVKTTGERPIFDYSLAVARGWKIGSKDFDNPSALLFIAVDDRKSFAQISKDLQDELPDSLATGLQRKYLVPAFKQGDYGKGVTDTIEAYIRTIESKQTGQAAEPVPQAAERRRGGNSSSGGFCGTVICLFIVFIVLMSIFSRFGSNNRGGRGGGGSGWGGGGFGGGTSSALPWVIGSIIANSSRGGSSSGDWGGGSSSGGGDSWGGFGGGGDFDGGGGGADW